MAGMSLSGEQQPDDHVALSDAEVLSHDLLADIERKQLDGDAEGPGARKDLELAPERAEPVALRPADACALAERVHERRCARAARREAARDERARVEERLRADVRAECVPDVLRRRGEGKPPGERVEEAVAALRGGGEPVRRGDVQNAFGGRCGVPG